MNTEGLQLHGADAGVPLGRSQSRPEANRRMLRRTVPRKAQMSSPRLVSWPKGGNASGEVHEGLVGRKSQGGPKTAWPLNDLPFQTGPLTGPTLSGGQRCAQSPLCYRLTKKQSRCRMATRYQDQQKWGLRTAEKPALWTVREIILPKKKKKFSGHNNSVQRCYDNTLPTMPSFQAHVAEQSYRTVAVGSVPRGKEKWDPLFSLCPWTCSFADSLRSSSWSREEGNSLLHITSVLSATPEAGPGSRQRAHGPPWGHCFRAKGDMILCNTLKGVMILCNALNAQTLNYWSGGIRATSVGCWGDGMGSGWALMKDCPSWFLQKRNCWCHCGTGDMIDIFNCMRIREN